MTQCLPRSSSLIALVLYMLLMPAWAQQSVTPEAVDPTLASSSNSSSPSKLERLAYTQNVLTQKLQERRALGEKITTANEQDKKDLSLQADEMTKDIQQLRVTLENLAIGGIDTGLFVDETSTDDGDWRKDIALIAQPVLESLKELTEKPRRLKELNDQIDLHQREADVATAALVNLSPLLQQNPQQQLANSLNGLKKLWEDRLSDSQSNMEIARYQIVELQGDKTLSQSIFESIKQFATGRGLTLLIAISVASAVYFGIRFLLRGYRAALSDNTEHESRTRYRLAAYSVHALTFLLILIAVFVVFYERGDVLLLGLLILLIVGLALGIRQLLPQYISEARLLLNVGPMRESERIRFRGLPWRVESINMYTVLRNPELHGVLRIPLAEFHGMTSRPSGKNPWFPSSRGDTILLDGTELLEVTGQNPDTVELKYRGGQTVSIPTADYYTMSMINLSRGATFGVTGLFGIDYRHQDISHTHVPKILRDAVRESLSQTDLNEFVKDTRVELKEANASSIDYWIFVTCDSRAAKSYRKIERLIQNACIEACTRESLEIPYPHISVVNKN
ncbi:mechanosensitive ion channel family protein [Granulosicoccus antarcticus]|uniref:Small-conductance mechanosensitive channel n=1 Tax=Granulosicoccus antarcticus IMCC3135 TaxID=1192854 RepID=A0A2Z2NKK2_9GAMM|nr:mechanosensitive ion channel family protein [Granulosicoccus antarcticus]ASJ71045.1 hypothetical protein IMCC3135_04660 [Granulosicoccus antarcticus IMCC3135]